MSVLDLEITKKCEHLLQTEPTFQPLKAIPSEFALFKSLIYSFYITHYSKWCVTFMYHN